MGHSYHQIKGHFLIIFFTNFLFFNNLFSVETNDNETDNKPPEEKKEPAAVA